MIRIRTKDNLIKWLVDNCPRRAVVRSILQHGVECLGGFSVIPPSTRSGWIVRTTSSFGKTWIVAILVYDSPPKYGIRILKDIPWQYYIGDIAEQEIYKGDNPLLYKQLRDICGARNETDKIQRKRYKHRGVAVWMPNYLI